MNLCSNAAAFSTHTQVQGQSHLHIHAALQTKEPQHRLDVSPEHLVVQEEEHRHDAGFGDEEVQHPEGQAVLCGAKKSTSGGPHTHWIYAHSAHLHTHTPAN